MRIFLYILLLFLSACGDSVVKWSQIKEAINVCETSRGLDSIITEPNGHNIALCISLKDISYE